MPIETNCPGCGKSYRVADAMAGRGVRCKDCGTSFTICAAGAGDGGSFLDAIAGLEGGSNAGRPPSVPGGVSWPTPSTAGGKRGGRAAPRKASGSSSAGVWVKRLVIAGAGAAMVCVLACAGIVGYVAFEKESSKQASGTLLGGGTQLAGGTRSNKTALCSVESLAMHGPGDYRFVELIDYQIGVHGIHHEYLVGKSDQWTRVWIPLHRWSWHGGPAPIMRDPIHQSEAISHQPVAAIYCSDKIRNEAELLAFFKRQTLVGEVFEKDAIDPTMYPKLIGRGGTLNPQTVWLIKDSAEAPPPAIPADKLVQTEPPVGEAAAWKVNEASEPLLAEPVDIGGYTIRPLKRMRENGRGYWDTTDGKLVTFGSSIREIEKGSESREYPTLGDLNTRSPAGCNFYIRNYGNLSKTLGKINGMPAVRYLSYFERKPGVFDQEFHYFVRHGDRVIDLRFHVSNPKIGAAEADAIAATLKRSWAPPPAINDEDCPVLKSDPERAKELGDRVAIGGISFQLPRDYDMQGAYLAPNVWTFYTQNPRPYIKISFVVRDRQANEQGLFADPHGLKLRADINDPRQAQKTDITYRRVGAFNVTRGTAPAPPNQADSKPYTIASYLILHGQRVVAIDTLSGKDEIPLVDEMIASMRPAPDRVAAAPISKTRNPPTSLALAPDWSLDSSQIASVGAYETFGDYKLRVPYRFMKFRGNPQQEARKELPILTGGSYTNEQNENYTIRISIHNRQSAPNFLFPRPCLIKSPASDFLRDGYDFFVVDADPGGFRYGKISGIPFLRIYHLATDMTARDGLKGVLDYVGLDGDRVIKIGFYGVKSTDSIPPEFDEMARSLICLKPRPPEESLSPTALDGAAEPPEHLIEAPEWITDKEFDGKLPVVGEMSKFAIGLPEGAKALSSVDGASRAWEFVSQKGETITVSLRVRPRAATITSAFPEVALGPSDDPKACDAVMASTSKHIRNYGRIDNMPFVRVYSNSIRGASTKNELTYIGLHEKSVITIRISPAAANGDPPLLDAIARSLRRTK